MADAPFLDASSVDRCQGWALRVAIGMRRDDTEALPDPGDARGDDEKVGFNTTGNLLV